jgi:putative flippase GtrA
MYLPRLPGFVQRLLERQVVRFLIVGAYNTLFGYVAFVAIYYALGALVHYNIVLVASYIVAVTNSYLLQRRFVFGSKSKMLHEFLRFNLVNLGGLFVNMGLLTLCMHHLTDNVLLAQAVSTVGTTAFIYLGHMLISFRVWGRAKG